MMHAILQSSKLAAFFLLRYETEHVPCTGLTAVTKQERRHFQRGVMIAPWHAELDQAKASIEGRAVVDTGLRYSVNIPQLGRKEVAVYSSNDDASIPAVYLAADDCFNHLRRVTLSFAGARLHYASGCGNRTRQQL